MNPDTPPQAAATPLQTSLAGVEAALQDLIGVVDDGGLTDLGAAGLVGFLQDYETLRNRMAVVDRAAIQYGTEQGVPLAVTERSMIQVLITSLRLSYGEAAARVKAAEHLADRHSMLGEPLPPVRPHLAAAQRAGAVTPEQVGLIDRALRKISHCEPAELDTAEQLLTEAAETLAPKELQQVAQRVIDTLDPDGTLPGDENEHRRRRIFHLKQRADGCWVGDFRLTPDCGQKLRELLHPLMNPQDTTITDDTGKTYTETDDRTVGQRRHDGLEAVLDRLLRNADNPDTGGTPTSVIIVISYEDFVHERGTGQYADGTPVSTRTVRNLADQADVSWCIKNAKGAVLDLHRNRRIATRAQTIALIARDSGCSFPGCQTQPQWCERHHIIPWWNGGLTNLNNLTLLCRHHHRESGKHNWTCRINNDGLPVWIPPKWIDPSQKPILNHRITINNWDTQAPLDFTAGSGTGGDPPDPLAPAA